MILYRWRGASTNFGDELNLELWPRLLPGFFDQDQSVRFLGIGSVLDQRHPPQVVKLVAGAGYGGYERQARLDPSWIVHWVRGPRTAALLGLSPKLGLGDPAALALPTLVSPTLVPATMGDAGNEASDIGFMPHFESAARGAWRRAAHLAGVRLIDPRDPPLQVLQAIRRCKLLLSEALHGAIVADALRVPWVAIRPLARVHRAKWLDWADTVELRPRFCALPASTWPEWAGSSRLSSWHTARMWLHRHDDRLRQLSPRRLVVNASEALQSAANAEPQLSPDVALDRCRSRMLEAIHGISRRPLCGGTGATHSVQRGSRLQPNGDSAYQLTPVS